MKRFNIRVYGVVLHEGAVLVSDERRFGKSFTKFPGGGLEWGEGPADCLRREFQEEFNIDCEVGSLLYVNEFFQESAFRKEDQLLSFYYLIDQIDIDQIPITNHSFPLAEEGEKLRWVSLAEANKSHFTFPVDKIVIERILDL